MTDVFPHHGEAAAGDPPPQAIPRPGDRLWVLVATVLGSSMAFINASTVSVALPAMQADLAAGVAGIQWIVNAYTLLLASLILLGGSLGDRYGRRRVFMIGVAIFAVASLASGLAPNLLFLIAARAVQGVGGALLTPGSLAIITACFQGAERGRAIGLWAGFSALTAALGPLVGGWLVDAFSWRWVFFILLPIAALVLFVSWRRVPESRDESLAGTVDWPGALLVTLGLAGVTFGFIDSSNRSFDHPLVWGSLAIGVVLLLLFVWVEARRPAPMVPLRLFRSPTFSGANGLTLLLYTALTGVFFFLPLNLIQIQGYSATQTGAAFLPTVLLVAGLSRWSGGLAGRIGARLPLIAGPMVAGAGYALLARPGVGASYWTGFFPALLVIGLGMGLSVAPLTTAVMDAAPTEHAGAASGVNNAVSRVANVLSVAILGVVLVVVFGARLEQGLSSLELPPAAQETILAQRNDLANLQPPASLEGQRRAAVARVVDEAFVSAFRVVMLLAAGLAFLGGVVAFFTIEPPAAG